MSSEKKTDSKETQSEKRQRLLKEANEVGSMRPNVQSRVLKHIINEAARSIM